MSIAKQNDSGGGSWLCAVSNARKKPATGALAGRVACFCAAVVWVVRLRWNGCVIAHAGGEAETVGGCAVTLKAIPAQDAIA